VRRFDGQTWTTYTPENGLAEGPYTAITTDSAGRTWVGTADDGVSMFDGETWVTYTEADGLADRTVNAIAIDAAGHPWLGTYVGVSELILPFW
jgi:ligand-binding sensor domain-containing protein